MGSSRVKPKRAERVRMTKYVYLEIGRLIRNF